MLQKFLTDYLGSRLSLYVEGLTEDSLRTSLWSGTLQLTGLTLKPAAIKGVEIISSAIETVDISIPWGDLFRQATVIKFRGISLGLKLPDLKSRLERAGSLDALRAELFEEKMGLVERIEASLRWGQVLQDAWTHKKNFMTGLLRTIVSNVQICLEDLALQIDLGQGLTCDLRISGMRLESASDKEQALPVQGPVSLLHKIAMVEGVSLSLNGTSVVEDASLQARVLHDLTEKNLFISCRLSGQGDIGSPLSLRVDPELLGASMAAGWNFRKDWRLLQGIISDSGVGGIDEEAGKAEYLALLASQSADPRKSEIERSFGARTLGGWRHEAWAKQQGTPGQQSSARDWLARLLGRREEPGGGGDDAEMIVLEEIIPKGETVRSFTLETVVSGITLDFEELKSDFREAVCQVTFPDITSKSFSDWEVQSSFKSFACSLGLKQVAQFDCSTGKAFELNASRKAGQDGSGSRVVSFSGRVAPAMFWSDEELFTHFSAAVSRVSVSLRDNLESVRLVYAEFSIAEPAQDTPAPRPNGFKVSELFRQSILGEVDFKVESPVVHIALRGGGELKCLVGTVSVAKAGIQGPLTLDLADYSMSWDGAVVLEPAAIRASYHEGSLGVHFLQDSRATVSPCMLKFLIAEAPRVVGPALKSREVKYWAKRLKEYLFTRLTSSPAKGTAKEDQRASPAVFRSIKVDMSRRMELVFSGGEGCQSDPVGFVSYGGIAEVFFGEGGGVSLKINKAEMCDGLVEFLSAEGTELTAFGADFSVKDMTCTITDGLVRVKWSVPLLHRIVGVLQAFGDSAHAALIEARQAAPVTVADLTEDLASPEQISQIMDWGKRKISEVTDGLAGIVPEPPLGSPKKSVDVHKGLLACKVFPKLQPSSKSFTLKVHSSGVELLMGELTAGVRDLSTTVTVNYDTLEASVKSQLSSVSLTLSGHPLVAPSSGSKAALADLQFNVYQKEAVWSALLCQCRQLHLTVSEVPALMACLRRELMLDSCADALRGAVSSGEVLNTLESLAESAEGAEGKVESVLAKAEDHRFSEAVDYAKKVTSDLRAKLSKFSSQNKELILFAVHVSGPRVNIPVKKSNGIVLDFGKLSLQNRFSQGEDLDSKSLVLEGKCEGLQGRLEEASLIFQINIKF